MMNFIAIDIENFKVDLYDEEEFIAALTHDLKVPIIAQDKTFDLFLQDKLYYLKKISKVIRFHSFVRLFCREEFIF